MRILVYGAGVQGCERAHRLLQNKKNVVTLLARGEWKERIDQKGLVIRSMLQFRTTTDRVATIDTLAPDDCYDLVFVAMQAGQVVAGAVVEQVPEKQETIRALPLKGVEHLAAVKSRPVQVGCDHPFHLASSFALKLILL